MPPATPPCPTCGAPASGAAAEPYRPFCSQRCRMVDLYGWLEGHYRLPATEGEDDERDDEDPLR